MATDVAGPGEGQGGTGVGLTYKGTATFRMGTPRIVRFWWRRPARRCAGPGPHPPSLVALSPADSSDSVNAGDAAHHPERDRAAVQFGRGDRRGRLSVASSAGSRTTSRSSSPTAGWPQLPRRLGRLLLVGPLRRPRQVPRGAASGTPGAASGTPGRGLRYPGRGLRYPGRGLTDSGSMAGNGAERRALEAAAALRPCPPRPCWPSALSAPTATAAHVPLRTPPERCGPYPCSTRMTRWTC